MNIDKIVKECPRAWGEWLRFIELDINNIFKVSFQNNSIWITTKDYNTHFSYFRTLYDFFDSVGIEIQMDNHWVAYCNGKQMSWATKVFDTRTEAEYKAFEKAFEIYENKLKEKEQ